ncbi:MAG: signal peptidase I [Thiohalospira sp.]
MIKRSNAGRISIVYVVFLLIMIVFILLFNTVYDFYHVNSYSMFPLLKHGDVLLIKKSKITDKIINRGSIYVFDLPLYHSNKKYFANANNDLFVKRCVAISGDTFRILKQQIFINSNLWETKNINSGKIDEDKILDISNPIYGINLSRVFYPHDSTYSWNLNNIGPLYIPKKNTKIQLTDSMKILYKDIIFYETKGVLNDTSLSMDEYTFKKNYYYFIGDNFYGSVDSRHWGMIPEENIIGEVKYIVWSKSNKYFLKRLQ